MSDEMDSYLSRCLKNWAARQPAPPSRRDELLQAAASPPQQWQEQTYFHTAMVVNEFSNNRMVSYYTGGWLRGSLTMSLAWPAQLATFVQFA